ncbi:glycosyltransferase [Rhodophyticola porphyridii]|uniref:Glycosyl transferase family 28 C-terminal domain-containing protein n=1 Tax=Rhodophyticola porphyridii TaxID=1852017 RepID=A0A3L9YHN2_9RHOB|nr:glycosyltransferase [Rhodophyticola porphyridii]RMA42340.1 hypothetical protein D9R08_09540 [Rhodophyticola porphyridii]
MKMKIECAGKAEATLDARVLFARQLASHGYEVLIDEADLPDQMTRNQKYEALAFVRDCRDTKFDRVIVLGAENTDGATQTRLRDVKLDASGEIVAIGRFPSTQERISAKSKIAYASGYEPNVIDLKDLFPNAINQSGTVPAAVPDTFNLAPPVSEQKHLCFLEEGFFDEDSAMESLFLTATASRQPFAVVTSGKAKERLRLLRYSEIEAYSYSEVTPEALTNMCCMASFFGKSVPGDRMAVFLVNLVGRGGVILDGTESGQITTAGAPAIRVPAEFRALLPYLNKVVDSQMNLISKKIRENDWLASNSIKKLEDALDIGRPTNKTKKSPTKRRVLFMPTNGVGLGHAQRSALVAGELSSSNEVAFAAFPSCVPMLQNKGFDTLPLVQKSDAHADSFANDLVNFRRLVNHTHRGDVLVFDGVYVFDSIVRATLENELRSVWIRRGLWQVGQSNATALERRKVFSRIIVPTEAFDELNEIDFQTGPLHPVGPIVQTVSMNSKAREELRKALSEELEIEFSRLVVTMLGGGVAADRSAQLQAICQTFERRDDVLNLVVVWPHATLSPSLHGWRNSIPVRTLHALHFCKAADFVISAAGYNSFHEVIYNQIPAIFVPQMAPFMDDQERRARSAVEREIGAATSAEDIWSLLRHVSRFLESGEVDRISARLHELQLPQLGQTAAARIVGEVVHQ